MGLHDEYLTHSKFVYSMFKSKQGSNHIATISSLYNILKLTKENNFSMAVDIGSGIGTISYLLLKNTDIPVLSFELNSWCIEQQILNLKDLRSHKIYSDLDDILKLVDNNYLLVIDDYLNWKNLFKILSKRPRFIFIEGYRNKQVAMISFYLFLKKISAVYFRSNLHEYLNESKSGSYFQLQSDTSTFEAMISWLKRSRDTKEFKEAILASYFFIRRRISIKSRLAFIKSIFYRETSK